MESASREKSACFTGHRPDQLRGVAADDLRLELQNLIESAVQEGYTTFYCGMAMGTDILAGELAAALRESLDLSAIYRILDRGLEKGGAAR